MDTHLFSDDRGNLTLFFRKTTEPNQQADNWQITNNAEHITALVRQHTNLKHFVTTKPYKRLIGRIYRNATEKLLLKRFNSKQKLLDQMFQKYLVH